MNTSATAWSRVAPGLLIAAGTLALPSARASQSPAASTDHFTATVAKGDLPIEVELAGHFVAEDKDEIRIEPKTYKGELIITALIQEGHPVKEGGVLMEFDPLSLERSLEDARNDVSEKQVTMDKAEAEYKAFKLEQDNTLSKNQKELQLATADLEKAREELQLELKAKDQSIEDAGHRLADARIDLEQLKQLYQERELHTATENILIEREERRVSDLAISLEKTRGEVALWKKYDVDKTLQEKDLEVAAKTTELEKTRIKLDADLKEKQAEVDKARRELEKAQREVGELEQDSQSLKVLSPRDGIVFYGTIGGDSFSDVVFVGMGGQEREMRIGGRVRTHQILMTVASMERLSMQMQVLENEIQHMKPGLPITIRPDAFPSLRITGKLTKVGQVASRSGFFSEVREFTIDGEYDGVYPQLRSGMNCRVTVHADTIPDAVHVPVLAVFTESGEFHCLVRDGGSTERRPVKLGATNGTDVQITEGLRPGEVVVLWNPGEECEIVALLELENITKCYPMPAGDVNALHGVSLTIDRGEFVSIVGNSGSGKTTLLYVLGLLTSPSAGQYRFDGRAVGQLSDQQRSGIRGRDVGFVFQSFHLIPQLNVLDNVRLSARYGSSLSDSELRRRATTLIERVGLAARVEHRPGELSGGEMQRVAIARTLLTRPQLILADEPTGNLDEATGDQIFGLLASLRDDGHTVILVTHDTGLAARTEKQIRLRDGEVIHEAA